MATEPKGNTAVPDSGESAPRDRVAMLSVNKDGSLDQTNPEIIGNEEFALRATKEQFKQQAVSAADDARAVKEAREAAAAGETVSQDPTIEARQKEHQKIADAAEKQAESTVKALRK